MCWFWTNIEIGVDIFVEPIVITKILSVQSYFLLDRGFFGLVAHATDEFDEFIDLFDGAF